jgi:hypothetical protein
VDLLRTGLGRSPDRTAANTPVGGSLGTNAGGSFLAWTELAAWGIVIGDPNLATATTGAPGRGASQSPNIAPGAFAGGATGGNKPGYGAGGGGAQQGAANVPSGDAYAYLTFTPAG